MDRQMLATLEGIGSKIRPLSEMYDNLQSIPADSHYLGQPGVGDAVNVPDTMDRFAIYIQSIVDSLCAQFGCDVDSSLDCIMQAADELNQLGMLPPLPEKGDLQGLAIWQGKAVTVQLGGYACKVCSDRFGGVPSPDLRNFSTAGDGTSIGSGGH